jgi:FeS assembly SUF system regulator
LVLFDEFSQENLSMLRISKATDYAILLLTHFAKLEVGTPLSARSLAQISALPLPTVSKSLKQLVRVGLLDSTRGANGGYSLPNPPERVKVADIIRALEGPIEITECSGASGGECRLDKPCSLKPNWKKISQAVNKALDGITLRDMAPTEDCDCASQAVDSLCKMETGYE